MLQTVKALDYMTKNLVTLKPEMDVFSAIEVFLKHKISGAPVVNEAGELVGILSESDCLRGTLKSGYYESAGIGQVSEYMSTQVDVINAQEGLVAVAEIFLEKNRKRLPVVEDGSLVGQISRSDILKAVKAMAQQTPAA